MYVFEGIKRMKCTVTAQVDVLRINTKEKSVEEIKDEVAVEKQLEVYINEKSYAIFSITPIQIKELVIGHFLTEGLIKSLEEIKNIKILGNKVYVNLEKPYPDIYEQSKIMLSACSEFSRIFNHLHTKRINERDKYDFRAVLKAVTILNSRAFIYRRTGGTHASVLLDNYGNVLAFSEDVNRHNAVDKVIGRAFLDGIETKKTLLASTGRLTRKIVNKVAQVHIPVLVSISAPTYQGVKAANKVGLTLIGFVRGRRLNVYTYPERLKGIMI